MADDTRVQQLLDELLDSHATPEEVCRSCVELLPVVRDRWRQICHARAELDAMFPPGLDLGGSLPRSPAGDTPLPSVPGYEVESVLGLGGMGVVFRARQLRLNRVVALKMALAGAYAGPHERERFQREAEAVAALRHPNVVQVHDVGDSDGRPYFTMEFVEGGSLSQKLDGAPIPARDAATLMATLAGAVQVAHQGGIVHRDLKPANVLLTADGTPKISDFGLARRLGSEAGLTRTGIALGTPSYMAPEQARGKADAASPAADIYALGAILYELLTGRPPFRAETGAETVHQVLTQEPVPPSRLNGKVPRDLETICLKCLHKEPQLRYASAAVLADDLHRFLRGETIVARPEGLLARGARRAWRRPVLSAAVAVATLSTLTLVCGGAWVLSERSASARATSLKQAVVDAEQAATERAAADDLDEMTRLQRKMFWPEATAALERAKGRLGDRGSAELRSRLDRGTRELELVARLDAIRLTGYTHVEDSLDFRQADGEYEEAFRRAGFGQPEDGDPAAVAGRITASPIAPVLVAALDHWASCCLDNPSRKAWLLEAIKLADHDMTGWRARAMNPATWKDDAALARLIETAPTSYPSLPVFLLIEARMTAAGRDPLPFLRRVQRLHPGDFWINFRLGDVLARSGRPGEAVAYYRAALGVRPDVAIVHNNLGFVLAAAGQKDEAIAEYRRAVDRVPQSAAAQGNLAVLLSRMGRHDEAIEQVQVAFRHNVRTAALYHVLGYGSNAKWRHSEAIAAFRQAIALDPKYLPAQSGLRTVLIRLGQLEEARVAWEAALAADPPQHNAWYGYAEFCLFLGRESEYRRARSELLGKFGSSADPYVAERTSRACLLLPSSGTELRQAAALADRVAAVDRSAHSGAYPFFLFVQGLAEYRRGRFDQAITAMRGDASRVFGPAPRLVLAMALHRSGQVAEARQTLAAAVASHDWRASQVRDQDHWIFHALRREAEGMIFPNLADFLKGKYQPQDNDERLALLGVCQFNNRVLAIANLYADAFAAVPTLAEDLYASHRFNAARAAVQVGCGHGDADALKEPERIKWRAQARQWLRADLAAWGKEYDGNPAARAWVRYAMKRLQDDPDLACIRESAKVDQLPAEERKECLALWAGVGALLNRSGSDK